jgi:hypothetical protein
VNRNQTERLSHFLAEPKEHYRGLADVFVAAQSLELARPGSPRGRSDISAIGVNRRQLTKLCNLQNVDFSAPKERLVAPLKFPPHQAVE